MKKDFNNFNKEIERIMKEVEKKFPMLLTTEAAFGQSSPVYIALKEFIVYTLFFYRNTVLEEEYRRMINIFNEKLTSVRELLTPKKYV